VQKKTSVKGVQVGGARRSREGERESEVEGAAGKFLDRIISVPLFSLSLSLPPPVPHRQRTPTLSLISLLPERAALGKPRPPARGRAQHRRARRADDDRLRVAEHDGDLEAALALDIHEVAVGRLDEPLELVLAGLEGRRRVEEVDVVGEDLRFVSDEGEKNGTMSEREKSRSTAARSEKNSARRLKERCACPAIRATTDGLSLCTRAQTRSRSASTRRRTDSSAARKPASDERRGGGGGGAPLPPPAVRHRSSSSVRIVPLSLSLAVDRPLKPRLSG